MARPGKFTGVAKAADRAAGAAGDGSKQQRRWDTVEEGVRRWFCSGNGLASYATTRGRWCSSYRGRRRPMAMGPRRSHGRRWTSRCSGDSGPRLGKRAHAWAPVEQGEAHRGACRRGRATVQLVHERAHGEAMPAMATRGEAAVVLGRLEGGLGELEGCVRKVYAQGIGGRWSVELQLPAMASLGVFGSFPVK